MKRHTIVLLAALTATSALRGQTTAPGTPPTPQQLYRQARASLVVVHYTWASELGPRPVDSPGVVIDASGVVMCNAAIVNDAVPLKQIQDVKIIVPRLDDEPLELTAEFQGRDDRIGMAFFKATVPHDWTPLAFTRAAPAAGDTVTAVGLLGRQAAYKAVIGQAMVSMVSTEGPQAMVNGRLPGVGAVIYDAAGDAVGYSMTEPPAARGSGQQASVFTPSDAFIDELADRPTAKDPVVTPWLGIADWNGMKPEDANYYGIKTPAIHIGGVCPGGPLDLAGIKAGDILVGYEGRPLRRGDSVDSVPNLLRQGLLDCKAGTLVHFDVVTARGLPSKPVAVTLAPMPALPNTAERYWSEELGMGVRDAVFIDRFSRRLPDDATGVVVTLVRPGSAAEASKVPPEAMVKEVDGMPVTSVAAFADAVKKSRQERPSEPVVLLVNQNGRDATLRIELRCTVPG